MYKEGHYFLLASINYYYYYIIIITVKAVSESVFVFVDNYYVYKYITITKNVAVILIQYNNYDLREKEHNNNIKLSIRFSES